MNPTRKRRLWLVLALLAAATAATALVAMVIGTKLWFLGSLLLRARADNLDREAGKDWVRQRAGVDAATEHSA